ncbi:hypothetical protein PMAYCL1PPCAC_32438, partial [Pristionchus mayeri]
LLENSYLCRYFGVISFVPLLVVPSIFCLIFLFHSLPETRGREVHCVVDELMERHKKSERKRKFRNISSSVLSSENIIPVESMKKRT